MPHGLHSLRVRRLLVVTKFNLKEVTHDVWTLQVEDRFDSNLFFETKLKAKQTNKKPTNN